MPFSYMLFSLVEVEVGVKGGMGVGEESKGESSKNRRMATSPELRSLNKGFVVVGVVAEEIVEEEEEEGVEVGSTRCRFLEEPIVIFCLLGEVIWDFFFFSFFFLGREGGKRIGIL